MNKKVVCSLLSILIFLGTTVGAQGGRRFSWLKQAWKNRPTISKVIGPAWQKTGGWLAKQWTRLPKKGKVAAVVGAGLAAGALGAYWLNKKVKARVEEKKKEVETEALRIITKHKDVINNSFSHISKIRKKKIDNISSLGLKIILGENQNIDELLTQEVIDAWFDLYEDYNRSKKVDLKFKVGMYTVQSYLFTEIAEKIYKSYKKKNIPNLEEGEMVYLTVTILDIVKRANEVYSKVEKLKAKNNSVDKKSKILLNKLFFVLQYLGTALSLGPPSQEKASIKEKIFKILENVRSLFLEDSTLILKG